MLVGEGFGTILINCLFIGSDSAGAGAMSRSPASHRRVIEQKSIINGIYPPDVTSNGPPTRTDQLPSSVALSLSRMGKYINTRRFSPIQTDTLPRRSRSAPSLLLQLSTV